MPNASCSYTTQSTILMYAHFLATFISSIASLDALVAAAPFLDFFNTLNPAVRGLIQGLLPTILLAIAFSLVPVILRCKLNVP